MSAEAPARPRLWRRVRKALVWLAAISGIVALVLAGLTLALTGPLGREWTRAVLDDRELAGYGSLEVGPVRGNVLGAFEIERLSVQTAEGPWLIMERIAADWSPLALLAGRLKIDALSADSVEVRRRPLRDPDRPETGDGGGLDLALTLDAVSIRTLRLADGVAGPAASFGVTATFGHEQGDWVGRFAAERLDAPGDRIEASLRYDRIVAIEAVLEAAPGGPLAQVLRADARGATARIDASGALDDGSGSLRLEIGEAAAVTGEARWTAQALTARAEVRPGAWPGFARLETLLEGPASVAVDLPLAGGLREARLDAARIDISAPAADLAVRPEGGSVYRIDARTGAGLASALTDGAVSADSLALADGRLDLSGDAPVIDGVATAEGLLLPEGFAVSRASGPVRVEIGGSRITVTTDLATEGARYGVDVLGDLLGPSPGLAGSAAYDRQAERLSLSELGLDGAAGPIRGDVVVDLAARRYEADLSSQALDVGRLTDLAAGRAPVAVAAEGGFDGSAAFTVEVSGAAPAGALEGRLSGPVEARIAGSRTADGALLFDRILAQSPDLAVEAAGRQDGEDWVVDGEAAWSGASPVGGLALAGTLEAAFEARYGAERLDARVDARAAALSAGPVQIEQVRLRARLAGPMDDLAGEARLTGATARGPVDVSADFSRDGDVIALSGLSGRAGGFEATGEAQIAPGLSRIEVAIAPSAGFGALSLTGEIADGAVSARLRARNLIAGDLSYVDHLDLTLDGPLSDAAFALEADGAYGARYQLAADGRMSLANGPFTLGVTLDGRYGPVAFETLRPVTASGGAALTVDAALRVGDGRVAFEYAGGARPVLTASLSEVPAAILSLRRAREPVDGLLSGEARLDGADGAWTGAAELRGRDLAPGGADEARRVDGRVTVALDREGLRVEASAQGPDLSATAAADIRSGPVSRLADLADPAAPLSAQARIDGQIGSIAAFHLGAGQSLSGIAALAADAGGTLGAPSLTGEASLTSGRFTDSATGLDLRDLSLEADFTRNRADIVSVSAVDGQGGRLTGSGRVEGSDGVAVDARAAFERFQLVARDDVTASASGEAAFAFADNAGRITGSAVIDRAEVSPPDAGRPAIPDIAETQVNVAPGLRAADARTQASAAITLDYQVTAPRRIFVRGSSFDTEWGAELAIRGAVSDPEVYGVVRAVRGRADLLGRVFEIESGVVRLAGDPREATLSLTAVREERDITARIEVEGAVTSPEISLGSTPSLPSDEVASRILFGEGAANLSGLQAAQLAASLASLSGSGGGFDPLGALRQASGLDQLGVRQNADGGTVVSGGRYLTEDVYLELQSGTASAAPATTIEWELTRRFTLLSRIDGDGAARVALSWRTEYDDDPFGEDGLFDFDRLDIFGLGGGADTGADTVDPDAPDAPEDPDEGVTRVLPRRDG